MNVYDPQSFIISVMSSGALSAVASWLASSWAFRVRFERFQAESDVRNQSWNVWREGIERDSQDKSERLRLLEGTTVTRRELIEHTDKMHVENRASLASILTEIQCNARDSKEDRKEITKLIIRIAAEESRHK